eukprot:SAG31_NODE_16579_length_703_cov_1.342715_1_plen_94_part_01
MADSAGTIAAKSLFGADVSRDSIDAASSLGAGEKIDLEGGAGGSTPDSQTDVAPAAAPTLTPSAPGVPWPQISAGAATVVGILLLLLVLVGLQS